MKRKVDCADLLAVPEIDNWEKEIVFDKRPEDVDAWESTVYQKRAVCESHAQGGTLLGQVGEERVDALESTVYEEKVVRESHA